MNITISGHHIEVTSAIREYIENKLERVIRHFDQVIGVTVTIAVDKLTEKEKRHQVDIDVHVPGKDIHVKGSAQGLYAAIDLLIDKLDRQVIKHKDKIQDHKHTSPKHMSDHFADATMSSD